MGRMKKKLEHKNACMRGIAGKGTMSNHRGVKWQSVVGTLLLALRTSIHRGVSGKYGLVLRSKMKSENM